jgi:adenylosuccinate synthase
MTYITRGMLFDPLAFVNEGSHLSKTLGRNAFKDVMVDTDCPVVLPLHVMANRDIEGRLRHGSTGSGVGVARKWLDAAANNDADPEMVVCLDDLGDSVELFEKLRYWQDVIGSSYDNSSLWQLSADDLWAWAKRLANAHDTIYGPCIDNPERWKNIDYLLRDEGTAVVFEGSQGMLLDKRVGWFPHVTYGDMDAFEARRLCGDVRATVIGVTRSYQTRHGNGPLPSEGTCDISERDNVTSEWAGEFRTGLLDVPSLARAASATCADEIAVSHMDRYPGAYVGAWHRWRHDEGIDREVPYDPFVVKSDEGRLIKRIEDCCHAPVTIVGSGPTTDDWHDR